MRRSILKQFASQKTSLSGAPLDRISVFSACISNLNFCPSLKIEYIQLETFACMFCFTNFSMNNLLILKLLADSEDVAFKMFAGTLGKPFLEKLHLFWSGLDDLS